MSAPTVVTDADFQEKVLQADKPVVVDFWAPWCGPCRKLAPILDEVAGELDGRMDVAKLNTDENPAAPGQFGVMSIPTLIIFKGGQEVERLVGVLPKPELKRKLEAVLG